MQRYLAPFAVLVAAAAVIVAAITRPAPSAGVTSCAQLAHDYVVQVAKANGLHVDYFKLQACHRIDANHTVARADVTVDQYGFTQSVTLVYQMTRSAWQLSVSAAS